MKSEKSIGFNLQKVTTEQFAIIPESYDAKNSDVGLNIGIQFGLSHKTRFIAIFVKCSFEQNRKPFIIIEVGAHFEIEKENWNEFDDDDENFIIPKEFAAHLVVLTIGTLRGVLHCKTEKTTFNKFILPTINVNELVEKDAIIAK